MQESKIGDIINVEGELYQVFEGKGCNDCDFFKYLECTSLPVRMFQHCIGVYRKDKVNVYFKKINNDDN